MGDSRAGEPGIEPDLRGPKPRRAASYTTPQVAAPTVAPPRYAPAMPAALIMAAGHGTRMRSEMPKVLHAVCGRPMLEWVVDAARGAGADRVVAVVRPDSGRGRGRRRRGRARRAARGRGDGLRGGRRAGAAWPSEETVLLLSGDHPLDHGRPPHPAAPGTRGAGRGGHDPHHRGARPHRLRPDRPRQEGPGRRRSSRRRTRPASATSTSRSTRSTSAHTSSTARPCSMRSPRSSPPPNGERYLTAVFPLLDEVAAFATDDISSAAGVNDRADLMAIEEVAQARILEDHARNGVTFRAPSTVVIDAVGRDRARTR